ncbi:MAG: hypothetical protein JWO38_4897 [Gemmataceae bacterium]|nr:hypothetical protein [Gemmataceae bacterium]
MQWAALLGAAPAPVRAMIRLLADGEGPLDPTTRFSGCLPPTEFNHNGYSIVLTGIVTTHGRATDWALEHRRLVYSLARQLIHLAAGDRTPEEAEVDFLTDLVLVELVRLRRSVLPGDPIPDTYPLWQKALTIITGWDPAEVLAAVGACSRDGGDL